MKKKIGIRVVEKSMKKADTILKMAISEIESTLECERDTFEWTKTWDEYDPNYS